MYEEEKERRREGEGSSFCANLNLCRMTSGEMEGLRIARPAKKMQSPQ
jgi:hypothetical protein